jgi:hypothetical protein
MTGRQYDLFVRGLCQELLDVPKQIAEALDMPAAVAPALRVLHPKTEVVLRRIMALDDVPPQTMYRSMRRACQQCADGARRAKRAAAIVGVLFDDMAFAKAEIETMPDGYRQALIVQRRRQRLAVVGNTQPCHDCGVDTSFSAGIGHFYTLHNAVWRQASGDDAAVRFLCLDCLEARLGHPLSEADFIATPPEILARFAGKAGEPLPPAERQNELENWRAVTRAGAL